MSRDKQKSAWWVTMIERYGSEEAVSEAMREIASKSRRNTGSGGFKHMQERNPERFIEVSSKGGRLGKRGPAKEKYGSAEEVSDDL